MNLPLQIKLRDNDDPSAKIRILRNIKGNLANQNGTAYNSIRLENQRSVSKLEGDGAFERFERDVRFLTREDRMKSNFEASFVK
ncbi:hypothetical protein FGO68_gene12927 [Halteria grandinella]|uniref:Uncharacterized protein n=1 Tax=Halteria grandinella TaxID=5974 RepID=A0A8J8NQX8_HALGN|nr:hypothetical protein FGO68_gene12927 [Halteria grandinella]